MWLLMHSLSSGFTSSVFKTAVTGSEDMIRNYLAVLLSLVEFLIKFKLVNGMEETMAQKA
jgi:hypothetical protein